MRCYYLSDLHMEAQTFDLVLLQGDVLIIAGDLCHARCLDTERRDRYSVEQRECVLRFVQCASSKVRPDADQTVVPRGECGTAMCHTNVAQRPEWKGFAMRKHWRSYVISTSWQI